MTLGNIPVVCTAAQDSIAGRVSAGKVLVSSGKWGCWLLGAQTEWWKDGRLGWKECGSDRGRVEEVTVRHVEVIDPLTWWVLGH